MAKLLIRVLNILCIHQSSCLFEALPLNGKNQGFIYGKNDWDTLNVLVGSGRTSARSEDKSLQYLVVKSHCSVALGKL